jgi:hypothetical protein
MNSNLQLFESAKWLAEQGTEQVIIRSLLPEDVSKSLVSDYYIKKKKAHRYGTHWLRCDESYTGTRVYRLLLKVYDGALLHRKMSLIEFQTVCMAYFMQFPNDAMSTNRIHYLIQSIHTGDAIVNDKCTSCKQPFVTHRDDCLKRVCPICELLEN